MTAASSLVYLVVNSLPHLSQTRSTKRRFLTHKSNFSSILQKGHSRGNGKFLSCRNLSSIGITRKPRPHFWHPITSFKIESVTSLILSGRSSAFFVTSCFFISGSRHL